MQILYDILRPLRRSFTFFISMLLLCVLIWIVEQSDIKPAYVGEVLVELYLLCVALYFLPKRVAFVARIVLYTLFYAAAVVDCYCFLEFETPISPFLALLVAETDGDEASEFIGAFIFQIDTLKTVGLFVGFGLLHWSIAHYVRPLWHFIALHLPRKVRRGVRSASAVVVCLALVAGIVGFANTMEGHVRILSTHETGEFELAYQADREAAMCTPIHRLVASLYAQSLTVKDIERVQRHVAATQVDSCSYTTPNLVLVIGESFVKRHSQLYGYNLPTTPRQCKRARRGELTAFTDVVTYWNMTSYAFKNLFSLNSSDKPGGWSNGTLFPAVFKKAGYKVSFLTNQFPIAADLDVHDFSGGFFLNSPELSKEMFDYRNAHKYYYDSGLLGCFDSLHINLEGHNMVIFHLIGQHMSYSRRCPTNRRHFVLKDIHRPDLDERHRQWVMWYDNSVAYNDSVLEQVYQRFKKSDAVMVYVPDHGSEVYDDLDVLGRDLSMNFSRKLVRNEYEIPFEIWCTPLFQKNHPDMAMQIHRAANRPFMTDDLPHLLLYLAGVHCNSYDETRNLIGPRYDVHRKRLLKSICDYDALMGREKVPRKR
jgi:heptose-I-phosphate ethanolaminephosphotransferase